MAGFAFDPSALLMFKHSDEWETMLLKMLKAQLSDPKFAVIKAISKDTGNVLGWQACGFLGKDEHLESKGAAAGVEDVKDDTKNQNDRTLRSVMNENFKRAQKDWMANRKYIAFNTLVVDPSAQGQGIGTALIRWVTEKADEAGIYCWLQASPVAHSLYLKAGFKDVDSFEVDLREFAPGSTNGGWGWGIYKHVSMLRLPES